MRKPNRWDKKEPLIIPGYNAYTWIGFLGLNGHICRAVNESIQAQARPGLSSARLGFEKLELHSFLGFKIKLKLSSIVIYKARARARLVNNFYLYIFLILLI